MAPISDTVTITTIPNMRGADKHPQHGWYGHPLVTSHRVAQVLVQDPQR